MTTDAGGLYRLMAWLSPSYPVGAFTLSHGLEWEVETGSVAHADGLSAWVGDVLAHGAGRQDAILLAAAYRARRVEIASAQARGFDPAGNPDREATSSSAHSRESGNPLGAGIEGSGPAVASETSSRRTHHLRSPSAPSDAPWSPAFAGMSGENGMGGNPVADLEHEGATTPSLAEVVELAAALNPSRERRVETLSQGDAFRKITGDVWTSPAAWPDGPLAYPVAVAIASADHGVDLGATLTAYLHAFAANIVSAGVRLIPLGQTDGQATLARLEPAIAAIAEEAATSTLDDLGGCALLADIASMRHETQYTRLFRT